MAGKLVVGTGSIPVLCAFNYFPSKRLLWLVFLSPPRYVRQSGCQTFVLQLYENWYCISNVSLSSYVRFLLFYFIL